MTAGLQAQEVAQLAINAREAEVDATETLQAARAELAATHIVHDKLQDEVAALTQRVKVAKASEAPPLDVTRTLDTSDPGTAMDMVCGMPPCNHAGEGM